MDRNEFVRRMHSQLDQWNNEVSDLLQQKEKFTEDVRTQVDESTTMMKQNLDAMRIKVKELETASAGAYDDMKAGVELASESLREAMQSAKQHFKDHPHHGP